MPIKFLLKPKDFWDSFCFFINIIYLQAFAKSAFFTICPVNRVNDTVIRTSGAGRILLSVTNTSPEKCSEINTIIIPWSICKYKIVSLKC